MSRNKVCIIFPSPIRGINSRRGRIAHSIFQFCNDEIYGFLCLSAFPAIDVKQACAYKEQS
jgi:hypothetical protein